MVPWLSAIGLSKRYTLGRAPGYGRLSESLVRLIRKPQRLLSRLAEPQDESAQFWALRDVSFDVKPGQVVGIIGRNGAGKSTLLKVLSRITRPTEGRAEIHGRVVSLLEVGTGFHPELTGRENIYLNGALLGMASSEIRKRFDDIVGFAELEAFIDTPVKRYSSGMYMRLGFAVAAHVEPDVLLVDEVLAVGDSRFQRRCLDSIEAAGRSGRIILFVSHNMSAITRLCGRVILLDHGRLVVDGPAHEVVHTYVGSGEFGGASRAWPDLASAPGNEWVRLRGVRIVSEGGPVTSAIDIRERIGLQMDFEVLRGGRELVPNFHLYNDEGVCLFITADRDPAWRGRARETGIYRSTGWIPGNFLSEGTILVTACISTMATGEVHVDEREVMAFQVVEGARGDSARGEYAGHIPGVIRPVLEWTTERAAPSDEPRRPNPAGASFRGDA